MKELQKKKVYLAEIFSGFHLLEKRWEHNKNIWFYQKIWDSIAQDSTMVTMKNLDSQEKY